MHTSDPLIRDKWLSLSIMIDEKEVRKFGINEGGARIDVMYLYTNFSQLRDSYLDTLIFAGKEFSSIEKVINEIRKHTSEVLVLPDDEPMVISVSSGPYYGNDFARVVDKMIISSISPGELHKSIMIYNHFVYKGLRELVLSPVH
jgi:hypothetical protein